MFFSHVIGAFQKRFGIPFTAVGREKITAIDVDRSGEPWDWVGHGMNDVAPQGCRVPHLEGLRPSRLDFTIRTILDTAPENIVLPASIDPNHRPHFMIMRHQGHLRAPDHI